MVRGGAAAFFIRDACRSGVVRRIRAVHKDSVRVLLIATHFDHIPENKRPVEMKWLRQFCKTEFRDLSFTGIVCLDATTADAVHENLWPLLRKSATDMVKDRTIPKFVHDLRSRWHGHQQTSSQRWLTEQGLLAQLQSPMFGLGLPDAEFAMTVLRSMGDVLVFDDGTIIVQPNWLSQLMAEVVKPVQPPFCGIEMKNGVVLCGKLAAVLTASRQPVGAPPVPALVAPSDVPRAVKFLQLLDVLFPLASDQAKLADESTWLLVPSRLVSESAPHRFILLHRKACRFRGEYRLQMLKECVGLADGMSASAPSAFLLGLWPFWLADSARFQACLSTTCSQRDKSCSVQALTQRPGSV